MKQKLNLLEIILVIITSIILFILISPNIIKNINTLKKINFYNQATSLYKELLNENTIQNIKNNNILYTSDKEKNISLSNNNLKYCIKFNNGNISSMKIGNDEFNLLFRGGDISDISFNNVYDGEYIQDECNSSTTILPVKNCTYNGEIMDDASFKKGQYTYTYYGSAYFENGWSVKLSDKYKYSSNINTDVCTHINGEPVIHMSSMFNNSSASIIDLSGLNTSNAIDMDYMFYKSNASKIIGLEYLNTSNVTSMSYMFSESKINKIDISNFDTSNVIDISYMFSHSQANEIKGLEKINTSSVTNMKGVFRNANVKELDLSNFDTSNVKNMLMMFYSTQIQTLDLSSFDTSNVTDMSNIFANSNLIEIKGLEKFDTSKVTGMYGMFENTKLRTIDISNFDTSNVTDMTSMFEGSDATEIKGLENLNTSKVTLMSAMFANTKIKTLDLRNFDTSNVTSITSMFEGSEATEIKGLEKFNTSNVEYMRGTFKNTNLKILDLSSFDTSKVTNMKEMFKDCYAKIGYARTQSDADKFNDKTITDIPYWLKFVVK